MSENYPGLFPKNYADSRRRFRGALERVRQGWPAARLHSRPLDPSLEDNPATEDLTLDWIEAGPLERGARVLVFTLGEHGVEGFAGSAMFELFVQEFLPRLDPRTTGLVLLHAINPWGMAHRRRVNPQNVDLNRNFVLDESRLDPATNPDYARIDAFLNPPRPVGRGPALHLGFAAGLAGALAKLGAGGFRQAMLLGQYAFPEGIYYGGKSLQEETRWAVERYRQALAGYEQVLLLDMHTGYGPRERMSVVSSVLEACGSSELRQAFNYPEVVKADNAEFYAIRGDMIDFFYSLARQEAPGKRVYAATFEFGTFGDGLAASLRGVRALVLENQAAWWGVKNAGVRRWIEGEFDEMFFPRDAAWRSQAVENARRAFEGILRGEGFLA